MRRGRRVVWAPQMYLGEFKRVEGCRKNVCLCIIGAFGCFGEWGNVNKRDIRADLMPLRGGDSKRIAGDRRFSTGLLNSHPRNTN